jgi:hypothetical protein
LDNTAVLKAAQHRYNLKPESVEECNRYAAALMLNRAHSDEAIKLTFQLYSRYPNSHAAIINHSCALLLNHRAPEARGLLEKLNPASLGINEAQAYYLALFEAYHDLKLWDMAAALEVKINSAALFPIQKQWLELQRKDIPAHGSQNSDA